VYDRTTQLVLQNGKVKQINRDFRNPKATRNQVRRNRSLIFASNGKVCMLEGFVYADKSSQVVFTEGITPSADKADLLVEKQVTRTFDSKGELVMNLWQESKDRKFPLLSEEKPVDQNAFSDLFALDRSSKPDPKRKELIQRMDEWLHQLQK